MKHCLVELTCFVFCVCIQTMSHKRTKERKNAIPWNIGLCTKIWTVFLGRRHSSIVTLRLFNFWFMLIFVSTCIWSGIHKCHQRKLYFRIRCIFVINNFIWKKCDKVGVVEYLPADGNYCCIEATLRPTNMAHDRLINWCWASVTANVDWYAIYDEKDNTRDVLEIEYEQ